MTREELTAYCLAKPGAWPDQPWEDDTVVKVHEKIFAFLGNGSPADLNGTFGVKCGTRDEADVWLERYPNDASPMPYLGRSGWNSLTFGAGIPDDEVLEAVDESYQRVVVGLPKKHRPDGWERP